MERAQLGVKDTLTKHSPSGYLPVLPQLTINLILITPIFQIRKLRLRQVRHLPMIIQAARVGAGPTTSASNLPEKVLVVPPWATS